MLKLKSKVTRALAVGLIGLGIPVLAGAKSQLTHHNTTPAPMRSPSKTSTMPRTLSHAPTTTSKLSSNHTAPTKLTTKSHTMSTSKSHKSSKSLSSNKKHKSLHTHHANHRNLTTQHRGSKTV
jgi:hypothetical protein